MMMIKLTGVIIQNNEALRADSALPTCHRA